jgi:hypothetical protein
MRPLLGLVAVLGLIGFACSAGRGSSTSGAPGVPTLPRTDHRALVVELTEARG